MKQKKNKSIQATEKIPQSISGQQSNSHIQLSFFKYIRSAENKKFLWAALIISIIYFIVLRMMYPMPLFYPDSFTYIQVARDHQDISFRPVQYSQIINFFKSLSDSDIALITGQYFSNVLANLFLFFTCTYFFPFRRVNRLLLFILLLCNPLYLFYSNFVLTDSFFASFTVTWFTFLIWILYKPKWYYTAFQLVLLIVLFKLRYNAVIFPLFTSIALLLSKQALWKKIVSMALSFLIITVLVLNIMDETDSLTGTRTFSAFAGWQMANNAMFILQNDRDIDMASIDDPDVSQALQFTTKYLDTAKTTYDITDITGVYMWDKKSPLKQYVPVYAKANFCTGYFQAWTALGPVYNKFGETVILQKPMAYIKDFMLPNAKNYFLPLFEAYAEYQSQPDTLQKIVKDYYSYKSNRTGPNHPWVFTAFIQPWHYLFPLMNVLFIVSAIVYVVTKRYKKMFVLFNKTLLCYSLFYLTNFFFIVLFAPTTFRYHIFIITLTIPILIWILQQVFNPLKKEIN